MIYDAEIAPLMGQIIALCQKYDIPMVATFQLTVGVDPLAVTMALVPEWADPLLQRIGARLSAEVARGQRLVQ